MQRGKTPEPNGPEPNRDDNALREGVDNNPKAEDLQKLLDEHGVNADALDSFGDNLLEELNQLQKEKPLVVVVAALALGVIIGRAFKIGAPRESH